ncbi:MAG TPA: hypothetical protein VG269_26290 [Tepidisphaeraceae bacterium]|jgi:hypothetical protein|nr:hypothetical protein [Tepidisphaeraceae bacterium]
MRTETLDLGKRELGGGAPLPRAAGLLALIVATVALAFAIHIHNGEYTPLAMGLVTVALVLTVVGVLDPRLRAIESHGDGLLRIVLGAGLTLQFFAVFVSWPAGDDQQIFGRFNHGLYLYIVGVAGLVTLLGYLELPSMRRWWFPTLLLVQSLLGFWMIRSSPSPHIDVWVFQENAPIALLSGGNPYAMTFPDIYHSTEPGHQQVYGDGLVKDDRLQFGFPYPPLSLVLSTVAVRVAQDARYAQAVALTLAGLLVGYARPGRLAKFAAVLLLFTPRALNILGRAWTEPFVVLFLAATIFCACWRLRLLLPVALGLLLASKQYLAFAVPLSFLLVPGFDWRKGSSWRAWLLLLIGAGATAAIVTLPLALRDWHAFWHSTVTVQEMAPFRWDALSYLVWLGLNFDSRYTAWVWLAFVMVVPAMLLAAWKSRRSPAGFALAVAVVYLPFIAFNKQAFCNYYFFVIGCLCCAIAAAAPADADELPASKPLTA